MLINDSKFTNVENLEKFGKGGFFYGISSNIVTVTNSFIE